MSLKVNISGSWREVPYPKINVSGTWRDVQNIYVKADGSWRPIYSYWYSYSYSDWSSCSASCGPGTQTRTATCYRTGNVAVADTFCTNAGVSKGSTSQSCNLGDCCESGISTPDSSLMLSGSTVYTVGCRAVYRHTSNKGNVMQWRDKSGTLHRTLVLDAAYRKRKIEWGPENGCPTGMTPYSNKYYSIGSMSIGTDYDYDETVILDKYDQRYTDEIIASRSVFWEDASSSSTNTNNIIASWPSGNYAAHFCRNNGSGISADLPNIQTLIRIYLCAEKIDLLDPTLNTNSDTKLSYWMGYHSIFSSTWYDNSKYTDLCWGVASDSDVAPMGFEDLRGVAPTLDL